MASKSAIIIGGGIGGLSLGARLAKNGYTVQLFEKNPEVGGRILHQKKKGYTIDMGPTFLLMPAEFDELFAYCGKKRTDYIEWSPLDPIYRLHYWDHTHLDVYSSLPDMRASLLSFDPAEGTRLFQQWLNFIAYENEKYEVAYPRFISKPAPALLNLLFSKDFPKLFALDGFTTMWDVSGEFFSNDKLKLATSFQSMYIGESPLVAPGTYSIIPFIELTQGIWFPPRGMNTLITGIEKLAIEMGVEIHTNARVEEIIVENNTAKGIRLDNGKTVEADIIVSNLDLPATYTKLIPSEKRKKYTNQKLDKLRYGCSAFMLYIGTKKNYSQLVHHNVFFGENYLENFHELFDAHELSTRPSMYVNVPSKTNPKIAPRGKHLLYVLVPVPLHAKKNGKKINWEEESPSFVKKIISLLEEKGLHDLSKNIDLLEYFSPHDWEKHAGMHLGSTFGLSPIFFQSSVFRPAQKSEEFRNMFFVGASTHPGSGMPLVLISARTCEEIILRDWKNTHTD